MRISRNHKKKLRVCALCITGNRDERKSKYNKKEWLIIARDFKFCCNTFPKEYRQIANQLY